jgi:hypothetical protein
VTSIEIEMHREEILQNYQGNGTTAFYRYIPIPDPEETVPFLRVLESETENRFCFFLDWRQRG